MFLTLIIVCGLSGPLPDGCSYSTSVYLQATEQDCKAVAAKFVEEQAPKFPDGVYISDIQCVPVATGGSKL